MVKTTNRNMIVSQKEFVTDTEHNNCVPYRWLIDRICVRNVTT